MSGLVLRGLDGANPLGFMAALGVLVALDDQEVDARLGWRNEGTWRPVVAGLETREEVVDHLLANLRSWADEPALELHYEKPAANGARIIRDLKPPPALFSAYLRLLLERGGRSPRVGAALGTDVAVDHQGATKPTAFHFTAGQQLFLDMVRELRDRVEREDLEEAVAGPWRYERKLPVLSWDCTRDRSYALRATDPSKDKKTGVPGADWLAFVGLRLLPCVPRGNSVRTTGVTGGWKTGRFTWPIWAPALSAATVGSLLQQGVPLAEAKPRALDAWGVARVLSSRIHRSDQGGYGAFSPPTVLR